MGGVGCERGVVVVAACRLLLTCLLVASCAWGSNSKSARCCAPGGGGGGNHILMCALEWPSGVLHLLVVLNVFVVLGVIADPVISVVLNAGVGAVDVVADVVIDVLIVAVIAVVIVAATVGVAVVLGYGHVALMHHRIRTFGNTARCRILPLAKAAAQKEANTNLTLWQSLKLGLHMQLDMFVLGEPTIVVYGLVPGVMACWSLMRRGSDFEYIVAIKPGDKPPQR